MSKWAHQQEMSHWCAGASCTAHLVPMIEYSGTSRAGCSTIGSWKSVLHRENQGTPKSQFTSTRCLGQCLWFLPRTIVFWKAVPPTPSALPGYTPSYDFMAMTLSLLQDHAAEAQASLSSHSCAVPTPPSPRMTPCGSIRSTSSTTCTPVYFEPGYVTYLYMLTYFSSPWVNRRYIKYLSSGVVSGREKKHEQRNCLIRKSLNAIDKAHRCRKSPIFPVV